MKPLEKLQLLSFESSRKCDMTLEHPECPIAIKDRFKKPEYFLTKEKIVDTAYKAKDLGFDGHIAWHYYCEPLLQFKFIKSCIEEMPGFKQCLWSNGNFLKEEHVPYFDIIHITNYRNHDFTDLMEKFPEKQWIIRKLILDDRRDADNWNKKSDFVLCNRPKYVEIPISNDGQIHLCCYDWAGEVDLGNIFEQDFTDIINTKYVEVCEKLDGKHIGAPEICLSCKYHYRNTNLF